MTRVRAANGGHTQLTLRKRLDVVDGIAFGRADLAGTVARGRPARRRRTGGDPARSAATSRSSSRSATSRRRATSRRCGRRRTTAGGQSTSRSSPGQPRDAPGEPVRARSRLADGSVRHRADGDAGRAGRGGGRAGRGRPHHACPVQRFRSPARSAAPARATAARNGGAVGPARTPAPSNVVIVDPRTNMPGTLVFVKQGNLWTQTGNKATPDHVERRGFDAELVARRTVDLLHRERPRPGLLPGRQQRPESLHHGLSGADPDPSRRQRCGEAAQRPLPPGPYTWFFWIRQPGVAPDGRTVAITSDGPDPTKSDVVLQTYDVEDGQDAQASAARRTRRSATRIPPGDRTASSLLYVKNGRDGTRGAPAIYRYDPSHEEDARAQRARATCSRRGRPTAATWR